MLKFNLVNGIITFVSHIVTYTERDKEQNRRFYDTDSKDAFCQKLDERNITYIVTDCDIPPAELLQAVEGKKFNTIAEAREFIEAVENGIVPKSDNERINDLELLVLQLGGVI